MRRASLLSICVAALLGAVVAHGDEKADPQPAPAKKAVPAKQAPGGQPGTDNPVESFFERLFGQRSPADKMKPVPPDVGTATWAYRDQVDRRVQFDVREAARVERARAAADSGDWAQVVDELTPILQEQVSWPYLRERGTATSTLGEALALLARVPRANLEAYVRQHSAAAQRELDEATVTGSPVELARVAARRFRTPAGNTAADRLASWHLDHGDGVLAWRWFELLLRADSSRTRDPRWIEKVGYAYRLAGYPPPATELPAELDLPEPPNDAAQSPAEVEAVSPLQEQWLQVHGTPSGIVRARGGDPLLLERWSHPVTYRDPLLDELRLVVDDLQHEGKALIPAGVPLAVNGKIAWRTLRGLQVFDLATGKLEWETDEAFSPEAILAGQTPGHDDGETSTTAAALWQRQGNESPDSTPMADLAFRDQARGALSSDGIHLFAVEQTAQIDTDPSNLWVDETRQRDELRRDFASNRLTSYRLDDGRLRWSVGGPAVDEPFSTPLAGVFFLGPPTPWRGALYVLGEVDQEIRLYVLDPNSGHERWSLLLGFPDAGIAADRVRRRWLAQPSVTGGIVVCPTTIGWLFAVDPVSRSVMWADRFSDRRSHRRGRGQQSVNQPLPLNGRWCASGPFITSESVVYAPPETPGYSRAESSPVACYDLHSGKKRWERRKESAVCVAGVFGNHVLLIGRDRVRALRLHDGKDAWTRRIPEADAGTPSGRGAASEDHYYLPLSSGTIWKLRLSNGEVAAEFPAPSEATRLGNLLLHRGAVVSSGPFELTAFEQRDAIEPLVARRLAANPQDAWALVRQARMALLEGEHARALDVLQRADDAPLTPEQRDEVHHARFAALFQAVEADLAGADREWELLQSISHSPEERLQTSRLAVRRAEARGDWMEAFGACKNLAGDFPELLVPRDDEPSVSNKVNDWAAGKLGELWQKLSEAQRTAVDAQLTALAENADVQDRASAERFLRLFHFHRAAEPMRLNLAVEYANAGDFLAAERHLLALARSESETAATAREALARLLGDHHAQDDVAFLLGNATVGEGQSHSASATELPDKAPRPAVDNSATGASSVTSWNEFDLSVVRSPAGNYSSMRAQPDAITPATGLPYYDRYRLRYHRPARQQYRLEILQATDDEIEQSIALRELAENSVQHPESLQGDAHQLVVLHGDVLHCLSPVEGRVLWTRPLAVRQPDQRRYYSYRTHSSIPPLQAGNGLVNRVGLVRTALREERRFAATLGYVAFRDRREITALDAASGDVRWIRRGVSDDMVLVAARDYLYLGTRQGEQALALHAADGTVAIAPELAGLLEKAVHVSGNRLTVVEAGSAASGILSLFQSRATVRQVDPITGEAAWTRTFSKKTQFALVEANTLFYLEENGEIGLLDLDTGQRTPLTKLTSEETQRAAVYHAVVDADRVYLAINHGQAGNRFSSTFLSSIDIDGELIVLERSTGRRLWSQDLQRQSLVVQDFRHIPVLLFATASAKTVGTVRYRSLRLAAYDKHTGRQMLDVETPANSDFQSLELDLANRGIELRTYNDHLRLVAVEREAAAAESD